MSEIRCIDVVEMTTEWMEGALPDEARVEIEEHLVICEPCATFVHQIRLTRTAVASLAPSVPAPFRDLLLERFSTWAGSDRG